MRLGEAASPNQGGSKLPHSKAVFWSAQAGCRAPEIAGEFSDTRRCPESLIARITKQNAVVAGSCWSRGRYSHLAVAIGLSENLNLRNGFPSVGELLKLHSKAFADLFLPVCLFLFHGAVLGLLVILSLFVFQQFLVGGIILVHLR